MKTVRNFLKRLCRIKVTDKPWLTIFMITLALWFFPVTYRIIRVFFIVVIPTLWITGVFIMRKHKWLAIPIFAAGMLTAIFLCLPGTNTDHAKLRKAYVKALVRYKGTVYMWGGENRIGIDCSGLVRNGFINANVRTGIITQNPKLIREAISLWWYDCSALALRDGYRHLSTKLFKAESINSINASSLLPGDMAVTADGVHILAFLGENQWIEADPDVMRTIIVDTPSDNIWFTVPVHILRWTQLQDIPNQVLVDIGE